MSHYFAADLQALPLSVFAVVLAITLAVTFWASRRTSTATEFWAAGRGVSGFQNGFAIAGDYMSASSFLGFAGLIFLFGVDGFVGGVGDHVVDHGSDHRCVLGELVGTRFLRPPGRVRGVESGHGVAEQGRRFLRRRVVTGRGRRRGLRCRGGCRRGLRCRN